MPTITIQLTVTVILIIIAAVFYIKNDIGKASFWLLAAILSVLWHG